MVMNSEPQNYANNRNRLIRLLYSLNREQSFVLYQRVYKGKKLDNIAQLMATSERSVETFSSEVNRIFDVQPRKKEDLSNMTYALLGEFAKPTDKYHEWEWPTEKLIKEFNNLANTQTLNWQVRPETMQDKVMRYATIPQVQIGAVIILIILVIILSQKNLFKPSTIDTLLPTNTLTITSPIIAETPTATIQPTNASTLEPTQTATLEPTFTPEPTITYTPNPTPTPEKVYFYHDFKDGFGPWEIADEAKATITDGSYVGESWLSIPCDLGNFLIEIKGKTSGTGGESGIYISPAYVDPSNNINIRTNYIDRNWVLCGKNGCYGISNITTLMFDYASELTLVIKVENYNMVFYINGSEITSFYNNKVQFGRIGIRTIFSASIRSVKIIELP